MREATVFSIGDSRSPSTWSNVPYCFTQALLAKEIRVNRVDLSPLRIPNAVYNRTVARAIRIASKRSTHRYFRSLVHFADAEHRIRKALRDYPNADANIFLTFSHSSVGLASAPAVHICDWTFEYFFKYFEQREPDVFENRSVRRENKLIERADLVISLFPEAVEQMRERYSNENIHYLGNAVNSMCEPQEVPVLEKKSSSTALLFIGSRYYLEGARCLIAAFEVLRSEYPDLTLDLIALSPDDFPRLPGGVTCHGYLDKGVPAQRELFYSLLQSAKVFINTTPKWAAFSATLEAMYQYTPVIVSPYAEFVSMFGADIPFGRYCAENRPEPLSQAIRDTLADPSYLALCTAANRAARLHTWSGFVDRLLELVNPLIVARDHRPSGDDRPGAS